MATDFEWNGKRWEAKKVRRKLTQFEHRGLAYYDRERMRQPLAPIVHPPSSFEGYSAPPSWATLPDSWGAWEAVPCGYFHNGTQEAEIAQADLNSPPIAQTAEYTLERCHVVTGCAYYRVGRWRIGDSNWTHRPVTYLWELTFADGAVFRFVSQAIAEAALSQLLKIRKAKHPRPRYGKHSAKSDCVYFTDRRLQKLAAEAPSAEKLADAIPTETAA